MYHDFLGREIEDAEMDGDGVEMNTMNVTDSTFRAWCLRCGMSLFVGIEGKDFTQENVDAFIFNVTHGYIGDQRGGCLQDASMMVVHPTNCARCGTAIERVVPVIPDLDKIASEFASPEHCTEEQYLHTPTFDAHLRADGSLFLPNLTPSEFGDVTISSHDVVALTGFLSQYVKVPALPDPDVEMFKNFVPTPVVLMSGFPGLPGDAKGEK
jgi:hypothetical protein